MRLQIPKSIGGAVRAVFPGPPSDVSVTIKTGGGGDLLGVSVNDAAAIPSALSVEINPENDPDLEPQSGDLAVTVARNGTYLPRVGDALEFANASTLERQVNSIRSVRKTGVVPDPDGRAILELGLTDPLAFALASGDLGKGIEASYTVQASQCPNVAQNFRATFTATVDGHTVRREVVYDVGLRESYNPASVSDIRQRWPDFWRSELEEWAGLRGLPALWSAYDRVETRIFATGRNPNRIRDVAPLVPLIVNRAFREMALNGLVPSAWTDKIGEYIAQLDKDFDALLLETMSAVQWYDDFDNGTGGLTAGPRQIGGIRLSR